MNAARPLHVGIVYWDPFTPGGVQSQVAGRLNYLGQPGGPVRYTVFTKRPPPTPHPWPHLRTEVFSGWDRLSLAVAEYTAARSLAKVLDRVHWEDPLDLVDLHAGGTGPILAAWSRQRGVPYVFVSHSLRFFGLQQHGLRWEVAKYYAWANRHAAYGARKVIAVSHALKQELVRFGIAADKIEVQHTATGPNGVTADGRRTGGVSPLVSGHSSTLRLLFVGRTSHDKGLDVLLEAIERCRRERSVAVSLTVVGPIDPQHEFCRRSRERSLPIEFAGPRGNAEVRAMMAEADVLVIPSRYDPCPVVAIEGLSAGTLILATNVGGLPEILQDGKTGILVEPDDAAALTAAITQIAKAPRSFAPMRSAGREASERFLWTVRIPEILNTYQCVLSSRVRATHPTGARATMNPTLRSWPEHPPRRMVVPMSEGLVSTIIPVHNRAAMLREAVASVLAQTYRPIEVIIVDDGSTDDTPYACQKLAREFPPIRHVARRENGGPGLARETGRQLARGEFLQYLDSDDLVHPYKFERQVAALRQRPECDVAYCFTRHYRIGDLPSGRPWKGTGQTVETMFPSFLAWRWWDTPNPLYRRQVCDAAGPWSCLRVEEDWEYDCRIASLGTRLVHCREYLVDVRDHGSARLSRGPAYDPVRLQQRARAHALIYQHARRAGLGPDEPHMKRFARELFLLGRQCGAAGLATESRELYELARAASGPERSRQLDFRLYRAAAACLGWQAAGRLACWADSWRGGATDHPAAL